MAENFACPFLGGEVQLTDERERHIAEHHPDLLPRQRPRIAETLGSPDLVRRGARFQHARLFSRWYDETRQHVVVVVVTDVGPVTRHWIVTAYVARRLAEGEIEWQAT
jgi:hypothetical protein